MNAPPFALGETVFLVESSPYEQVEVPCPVCFGKRSVVLILGNGEHQPVVCEYCSRGCEPPSGRVTMYGPSSTVTEHIVQGVNIDGDDFSFKLGWRTVSYSDGVVFRTLEEAEPRRRELHAKAEEQARKNWESQFKNARGKVSWTVGYHRKALVELRRQVAWHEAKLSEAKP